MEHVTNFLAVADRNFFENANGGNIHLAVIIKIMILLNMINLVNCRKLNMNLHLQNSRTSL